MWAGLSPLPRTGQSLSEPLRGHRLHLLHHLSCILFTWAEHTVLNVAINTSLAGAHMLNCAFLRHRTQADKTQVASMTTEGVQHSSLWPWNSHTDKETGLQCQRWMCAQANDKASSRNTELTKHFDIFNLCLKPTSFTTMVLSPTVVSLQGQIDWLHKSCPRTTTEAKQEARKDWKLNLLPVC